MSLLGIVLVSENWWVDAFNDCSLQIIRYLPETITRFFFCGFECNIIPTGKPSAKGISKHFFLTSELGNEYLAIIFYYIYLELFEQFAFDDGQIRMLKHQSLGKYNFSFVIKKNRPLISGKF